MTGRRGADGPSDLEREYAEAFAEWYLGEDAALWDMTVADGLDEEEGWDPGDPTPPS